MSELTHQYPEGVPDDIVTSIHRELSLIRKLEAKAEPASPKVHVKTLHAKIGELTMQNDVSSGTPGKV